MSATANKLGEYRYNGNGQTLENDESYTAFETDEGVEMFPTGRGSPVVLNRGNFTQMEGHTLERLEGATPMR